jgi:hypothetical protein
MNAYYIQKAEQIFPIYGVSSMEEAKQFVGEVDHRYIVETDEEVYMNIPTGSVDFASGWDDLDEVVQVKYDADLEQWVEA